MSFTNGFTKTALDGAWQPKLIEGFWGVRLRALASCGGKLLQGREVRATGFLGSRRASLVPDCDLLAGKWCPEWVYESK